MPPVYYYRCEKQDKNLEDDIKALEQERGSTSEKNQILTRISSFTSVITRKLDDMTFHERQTLIRKVLKEAVINGNKVKLYFKIPLPKAEEKATKQTRVPPKVTLSSELSLRSRCDSRRRDLSRWHPLGLLPKGLFSPYSCPQSAFQEQVSLLSEKGVRITINRVSRKIDTSHQEVRMEEAPTIAL